MTDAAGAFDGNLNVTSEVFITAYKTWTSPKGEDQDKNQARIHLACVLSKANPDTPLSALMRQAEQVNEIHHWPLTDRELIDVIEVALLGGQKVPEHERVRDGCRYDMLERYARHMADRGVEDAYLEVQRENRYCDPPISDKMVRKLVEEACHENA